MNKKLLIIIGVIVLVFTMVFLVMAILIENKTTDATILNSGQLEYQDNESDTFLKRTITSDGKYRLRLTLFVDRTYIACAVFENITNEFGENQTVCTLREVRNFTGPELDSQMDVLMNETLLNIAKVQGERNAKLPEVPIRKGDINTN